MNLIPLYIHVPFCRKKCGYCTFYSTSCFTDQLQDQYTSELINQIHCYCKELSINGFSSIFIGGGTPSLLGRERLGRLLKGIDNYLGSYLQEFTIECNPEDLTEDFLHFLEQSPIDRISLGIQSFSDKVLQASGRHLSSKYIFQALERIDKIWTGRFSLDLISGLAGQTLEGQQSDIDRALEVKPDHISCYSLILDESVPIAKAPDLPSEDLEGEMWELCRNAFLSAGYNHYEVSNFALPGQESLHNLEYWKMNPFLGCGPGAIGMVRSNGIYRISNPRNLNLWLKGQDKNWNIEREEISSKDFLFENYMMGLRTESGIDKDQFRKRFGSYPEEFIPQTIKKAREGTFIINDDNFKLEPSARLYMNPILLEISDELDDLNIDFTVNWP